LIVSPNQSNIFTVLRSYLLSVLPPGVDVLRSQVNRVAEPVGADFVMMTPLRQERLETNVDSFADCLFNASIAGNILTVNSISIGKISVGAQVFGIGLSGTLTIVASAGGTGGPGNYQLNGTAATPSQIMAAGLQALMQPTEWTIQLDCHGPNSSDNASIISTTFRDSYALNQFATSGFDVTPLYADDPKQVVFISDQEQMEDRWIVEACMQANQVVSISQQFADIVSVTLIRVP
jgi:hypothetical protein